MSPSWQKRSTSQREAGPCFGRAASLRAKGRAKNLKNDNSINQDIQKRELYLQLQMDSIYANCDNAIPLLRAERKRTNRFRVAKIPLLNFLFLFGKPWRRGTAGTSGVGRPALSPCHVGHLHGAFRACQNSNSRTSRPRFAGLWWYRSTLPASQTSATSRCLVGGAKTDRPCLRCA